MPTCCVNPTVAASFATARKTRGLSCQKSTPTPSRPRHDYPVTRWALIAPAVTECVAPVHRSCCMVAARIATAPNDLACNTLFHNAFRFVTGAARLVQTKPGPASAGARRAGHGFVVSSRWLYVWRRKSKVLSAVGESSPYGRRRTSPLSSRWTGRDQLARFSRTDGQVESHTSDSCQRRKRRGGRHSS